MWNRIDQNRKWISMICVRPDKNICKLIVIIFIECDEYLYKNKQSLSKRIKITTKASDFE